MLEGGTPVLFRSVLNPLDEKQTTLVYTMIPEADSVDIFSLPGAV